MSNVYKPEPSRTIWTPAWQQPLYDLRVTASSLMDTEHIDGLLIGGASLIAKKFIDICSTI